MKEPKAKKINKELVAHQDIRVDPYYWLNERENPEVIAYLEQENAYCDFIMKDTEKLQKDLFEEMKSRYKEDDESLPYFFNKYWYITKFVKGGDYPIFERKYLHQENDTELLLDVNILAKGFDFYDIGSISISPNNSFMAYSEDTTGRRIYSIRIKNLETKDDFLERIDNTTGDIVWANDNQNFFYVKKDEKLRAYQVFRHKIGTSSEDDVLVFCEEDETFDVSIFKTKSLKYIFIKSSSTLSDENRFISADDIFSDWKIIHPREEGLEYSVEHYENYFYILTNAGSAINFKLVKTPVHSLNKEYWEDIVPHRNETLLEGFEIFKNYLVLEERTEGLLNLKVINNHSYEFWYLPFSDSTYTAYIGRNLEFDTDVLQFGYTSLTTPNSIYEYNMREKTTRLLKQREVLDTHFLPENYIAERLWAKSRDGKTKIPISLVYHKDTPKTKDTPLLLYGYGSYGITIDAAFSSTRLSLLNRGFIYAIAHIRGGEYLGRSWYEQGKMLQKKNTFFDFIDVAKFLIEKNYTSSKNLYASGGSAGGLLIGAIINEEPCLFKGVIAQVPFVDVVTTMLDESIPLTTGEYDEWGNPNEIEYYKYMKSYSPYDNVAKKPYPNILVTTGFHDGQVQYWEPAKWVAKLREMKTNNDILIFKTNMNVGHSGASGRFESLKEEALEYAFLLKLYNYNNEKWYNE